MSNNTRTKKHGGKGGIFLFLCLIVGAGGYVFHEFYRVSVDIVRR